MLIQSCLGIRVCAPERRVEFSKPRLPRFLEAVRIDELRVGSGKVDLLVTRRTGTVEVHVERAEGASRSKSRAPESPRRRPFAVKPRRRAGTGPLGRRGRRPRLFFSASIRSTTLAGTSRLPRGPGPSVKRSFDERSLRSALRYWFGCSVGSQPSLRHLVDQHARHLDLGADLRAARAPRASRDCAVLRRAAGVSRARALGAGQERRERGSLAQDERGRCRRDAPRASASRRTP